MIQFSDNRLKEIEQIIARYPAGKQKSALLPVLHLAQQEFGGWLDVPVMDYVASLYTWNLSKYMKWLRFTACII
ncbi:MAG: NAD(P)H-dependent oxidoreductase subunit E [Chitinophagaceae bacterium]